MNDYVRSPPPIKTSEQPRLKTSSFCSECHQEFQRKIAHRREWSLLFRCSRVRKSLRRWENSLLLFLDLEWMPSLGLLWILYLIIPVHSDDLSSFGIKSYQLVRAIDDPSPRHLSRGKRSLIGRNRRLRLELAQKWGELFSSSIAMHCLFRNLTLVLKPVDQFFPPDADLHLGSSTYLPLDSTFLYEGYVSGESLLNVPSITRWIDHPDTSHVSGGFYSNWFDGTIQLSNETWHVEPMEKYGLSSTDSGRLLFYNTLDVDLERYENSRRALRSTGTRQKRQSNSSDERSCCQLYIRVDPALWDLVYRNEGLQVRRSSSFCSSTSLPS